MRVASVCALVLLSPALVHAAVVINEVAWMGTATNANAEWVELYNPDATPVDLTNWHLTAGNGSPSIALAGTIGAGGYFLLERTSDASVPNVTADQIYTGALTNAGTTLTLANASGATVDQVIGGANWVNIGGDNASKETAQRTVSGWETAIATPRAANVGAAPSSSRTVSTTSESTAPDTTSATTTVTTTSSGGGPPEFLPVPTLRIVTANSRSVSSGADTAFTAAVYDNKSVKRNDAIVTWSFGDGMRKIGANVFHAYYEPGEYLAIVHANTADGGDTLAEVFVTVKDANIRIAAVSPRGVTVVNNSARTLDLSRWRLLMGGKEFTIPEDTHVLAGRTVLFPARVIELPLAAAAVLLYPDGEVATTFPMATVAAKITADMQPSPAPVSYEKVQAMQPSTLSPITSTKGNIQAHEEGARAPTATTELAAVGAASPAVSFKLLKSPWTLSFLGIVALAGGAFILL